MLVFSAAAFADKGTPSGEGMNWADNPDVTFYWIDPGGTVLSGTPPISDQIYEAVFPGGFTFNFYGQNFDRVYVSTNGFITFNNITEAYP
ncbi:MAG: hypothetical protein KDI38_25340, partial [Calditrichaeota bacterium]|nr:hypothetical protein [Calditrichota bacterium]